MMKNQKQIFMITGTGRSGSTLLDMMLGNDPHGFSVGEIHALFRPWRSHHILDDGCFCKDKECNFWSDLKERGEKEIYENIFENKKSIEFIVDSSKNPLWLKDQIKYSKDKDYTITPLIIYKTPLEYAYSLYKRNDLENWYSRWVKVHRRLFGILEDFVAVKYQELAKDPDSKLKSLCDELGLDHFKDKKKFWNNQHDHFLFGSGTVKSSDHLVYYEDQYDPEKLEYLRDNVDLEKGKVQDILKILEAYEVDTTDNISRSIKDLKERIGSFTLRDRLILRSTATSSYTINKNINKIKNLLS